MTLMDDASDQQHLVELITRKRWLIDYDNKIAEHICVTSPKADRGHWWLPFLGRTVNPEQLFDTREQAVAAATQTLQLEARRALDKMAEILKPQEKS